MRRLPGSALIFTLLALLWIGAAGAARAERYPVDYNFFAGIPGELLNHNGSLPGSNDWGCRPSAAHPNPVVLVHGTGGGAQTNWGVYVPLLADEGYCVYSLTYGAYDLPWPISAIGGMRPIEESGPELAAFVDRVLAATGARRVDLVGHSQGNVVSNYYIKRLGGADKVDKMVALAPPWLGTNVAGFGDIAQFGRALGAGPAIDAIVSSLCHACGEVLRSAPFMDALNSDGIYQPEVTYTNIATVYDEGVVPYTAGLVPAPNATDIVVQDGCAQDYSEHAGIAGSPRAAAYVLNALDPSHPREAPCEFIPPFTG
ncbi:esterase/lipase family protein [Nocardia arthritidis]|uniref:Alpha/beta fold hydrolase n=1 Tax=Nocardia arthritidis TaxID=228602 RepID=A0A6G9Y578_9NOCA|nr:alpha/beta fold hydrolase [Nocardia arthritidis]QIS08388.1 alpha/beta fold hydrolase [Nocardia arthritidis]